jgi:hypothetical protein
MAIGAAFYVFAIEQAQRRLRDYERELRQFFTWAFYQVDYMQLGPQGEIELQQNYEDNVIQGDNTFSTWFTQLLVKMRTSEAQQKITLSQSRNKLREYDVEVVHFHELRRRSEKHSEWWFRSFIAVCVFIFIWAVFLMTSVTVGPTPPFLLVATTMVIAIIGIVAVSISLWQMISQLRSR